MERCSNNAELARVVMEKFQKQAIDTMAQIEDRIKECRPAEVAGLAHGLKGTAGIVAAERLRRTVEELEKIARSSRLEMADECFKRMREEIERCSAFIDEARMQGARSLGAAKVAERSPEQMGR